MKYMLLIYDNEADFDKLPEKQITGIMEEYGRLSAALKECGAHISSHRLRPVASAACVRIRSGQTMLTDGPLLKPKSNWAVTT